MLNWSLIFLPEKIEKGLICNWNIRYLPHFLHLDENWDRDKGVMKIAFLEKMG